MGLLGGVDPAVPGAQGAGRKRGRVLTRQRCVHSRPFKVRLTGLSLSLPRASFRPSSLTTASNPPPPRHPQLFLAPSGAGLPLPPARSGPPSFPGFSPPNFSQTPLVPPARLWAGQEGAPTLGSRGAWDLSSGGPSLAFGLWGILCSLELTRIGAGRNCRDDGVLVLPFEGETEARGARGSGLWSGGTYYQS